MVTWFFEATNHDRSALLIPHFTNTPRKLIITDTSFTPGEIAVIITVHFFITSVLISANSETDKNAQTLTAFVYRSL